MKFENYAISETLKQNLAHLGFKRPTDIQFKTIPPVMNGEDVLAVAQTGTGKTAAFAIPVIHKIQSGKRNRRPAGIRCIVLVPTRELAMQIGDVFTALCRNTRIKPFALVGGVEQDPQIKTLKSGIDILIATPGRMFDLISQGWITLDSVDTLVLDEADRMLDLGFIDDIRSIKKKLVKRHQTLFFSATIDRHIKKLAYSQVKSDAIRIQISPEDPVSKNVSHYVMSIEMDDKRFFLERFINEHPKSRIIVFVRTRIRSERVTAAMARVGITAVSIHGAKDQSERSKVMETFRDGDCRILVATDVSARGIDIPEVDFVINYDLPDKPEYYVHRVGRTGRGTRKGIALSFCAEQEKDSLDAIQVYLKNDIEVIPISQDEYAFTLAGTSQLDVREMILEYEHHQKKNKRKTRKKKDG